MSYLFRVFRIFRDYFPNVESLNMTSLVSQISRKAISWNQGRFWRTYSLANSVPLLPSGRPQRKRLDAFQYSKKCPNTSADTNHRELMFTQISGQPNGHQLPRAPIRTGVGTANWRLKTIKTACNRPDARAKPSGLDDWKLMKKHVKSSERKSVAACHPDA